MTRPRGLRTRPTPLYDGHGAPEHDRSHTHPAHDPAADNEKGTQP